MVDAQQQRPSKGMLETAFGTGQQNRHRRSGSAGQEALKKLQRAFPSFNTPSQLLPSFQGSFFSNFSEKHFGHNGSGSDFKSSPSQQQAISRTSSGVAKGPQLVRKSDVRPSPLLRQASSNAAAINPPREASLSRPVILRRTTSDESILYHSLSRASSLGDDSQFQDVREMVNMRLMAIKDSLPDGPKFRMPSLPKVNTSSWRSSLANGLSGSSNPSESNLAEEPQTGSARPSLAREASTQSKDETALDRVLQELTGDLVVLGGYRGSILRSAEAPHQQLWAPVKVGLNIRKANLEVGLADEDEERAEETIKASGMLKHIGPIDISRKFIRKLQSCENARNGSLRIWDYGYDWRLSPHILSRKLSEFLERLPSNREGVPAGSRGALVLAHSLGGMITRHVVNQKPHLFSGVLYAGVPQRCINVLGPLRNGDVVLLNEKLLTAAVNFSIRTSFVFLPEDGFCFVDKNTGEEYPVDFFDPQAWAKWALSPCVGNVKPALSRPTSSSLASFLPNPLRQRANSKSERKDAANTTHQPTDASIAPQMTNLPHSSGLGSNEDSSSLGAADPDQRQRYMEYLGRTLAKTKRFRAELAHQPQHQENNAYPPLAVLYGKTVPTVFAVQVHGREGIACADAYDDLLFRPGDGVVLAKEAMLPDGYAVVRGGRVSTERGHITMLGDMPAVGRALEALVRGRRKGIGLGERHLKKRGPE